MSQIDADVPFTLYIPPYNPHLPIQPLRTPPPLVNMDKGQEEVDVAESFVTAFYHDSEGEDVSVQTRNEDIFELYWNSRPLIPLERRNPEDATTDCNGDPTSQIFLIGPKILSHDNSQNVREDIIRSKSNVGLTENREENDATPATKRTMPESETASEGLPEEKTPVEEV